MTITPLVEQISQASNLVEEKNLRKSYRVWMLRFRQQHWWPGQFSPGWQESRWREKRPGRCQQPICKI